MVLIYDGILDWICEGILEWIRDGTRDRIREIHKGTRCRRRNRGGKRGSFEYQSGPEDHSLAQKWVCDSQEMEDR